MVEHYISIGCLPGGTQRNFESYGHLVSPLSDMERAVLCDPQTSGGLLLAVRPPAVDAVRQILHAHGVESVPFGQVIPSDKARFLIDVRGD